MIGAALSDVGRVDTKSPFALHAQATRRAVADAGLTRDDVDCSVEGLDDTGEFQFVAAHYVVDGNLGATCFGGDDPTLTQAWEILSAIVPGGQLRDLALFGGFAGTDEGDEVTLAFVNGREGVDEFQMSVNLDEASSSS